MRAIGFSTGALAKGDFEKGIALQNEHDVDAIELSALRETELEPLVEAIASLVLTRFSYISVLAPSRFVLHDEPWMIELVANDPR